MVRLSVLAQNFPCSPAFTEKNLPSLAGKVCLVTGANTGIGRELTRLLYAAHATVYMACRSEAKAKTAMDEIKAQAPTSTGKLEFVAVDLADLRTIKPAAESFLAREPKLHVLFNNAGVMLPAADKKTAQGYDMQLGTNCVGPFLLTQLLTPALQAAAAADAAAADADTPPPASVRVVWVSSIAAELYSGRHGLDMANIGDKGYLHVPHNPMQRYGNSKAGNYLHSVAYAHHHTAADGIVSVALNPGNLDSELYRTVGDQSFFQRIGLTMFTKTLLHPVVYGAYTELFAGFSPDVTVEKSGAWIGPWGRFFTMRHDVEAYGKTKAEGGGGGADAFWDWSMEQVKPFM